MIVQHDNMVKSGQFTEAQTVAQNIENATAEVLANAQAENIAARTGLTKAQTSAIATELAQADKRLSLLDRQLQIQYPQEVGDIQNVLTPAEKNKIRGEIYKLRENLLEASIGKNEGVIEAAKRSLEIEYAQLGFKPLFDTRRDEGIVRGTDIHRVASIIPLVQPPTSPRTNGGDTGDKTSSKDIAISRFINLNQAGDTAGARKALTDYNNANRDDQITDTDLSARIP
jgi:hypothetical protein